MPRPTMPPTPASSTDLMGQDGKHLASLEVSFSLPPPAMAGKAVTAAKSKPPTLPPSYQPASPTSPRSAPVGNVAKRRRSSIAAAPSQPKDSFSLPPPPTRSRKIIQMKPRPLEQAPTESAPSAPKTTGQKLAAPAAAAATAGKKKQPSATSVAGRKIARKTAHSLIERRRRSKMNEEFSVLQQMIPACQNQEMHKLAILQASIEYTRYLEQCILDLKANAKATGMATTSTQPSPVMTCTNTPISALSSRDVGDDEDDEDEDEDDAVDDMHLDRPHQSMTAQEFRTLTRPEATSPAFPPERSNSFQSYSTVTSPAIDYATSSRASMSGSTLTSPALLPQLSHRGSSSSDHEATEALLMLNADRRGSTSGARGMSVKDLLSS